MKCPVCPSDIPDDCVRCTGCGTDLTPVQKLRELAKAEFNAALGFVERGETETALVRASAAVAIEPRFLPARTLAGKLLWQLGRHGDAVSQWRAALAFAPEDPAITELLAAAERTPDPPPPGGDRVAATGGAEEATEAPSPDTGHRPPAPRSTDPLTKAVLVAAALLLLGTYLPFRNITARLEGLPTAEELRSQIAGHCQRGVQAELRTWTPRWQQIEDRFEIVRQQQIVLAAALESLAPAEIKTLSENVRSLRAEKKSLLDRETHYRARRLTPADLKGQQEVVRRLDEVEQQLIILEPQFDARVTPWEQLRNLKRTP